MQERRRQVRRQAEGPIFACDSQTGAFIGQVANMTEQGALLLSEKPTPPNTIVQCRITLPERTHGNDDISFEAESRWCVRDDESGMYHTGYQFRRMTPEKHAVIRALLRFWSVPQAKKVQA